MEKTPPVHQLMSPYDRFLKNEDWPQYMAVLSQNGLTWWFNQDLPALALHVAPLAAASDRLDGGIKGTPFCF